MKALVTGGGGFLGSVICRKLVESGYEVRSLCRGRYPEVEALGVEAHRGDIADYDAVRKAAGGCDVVFHVAAKAGMWGRYADYYAANVTGTENVLRACCEVGIGRLVYTSTPSVVHRGGDVEGIDESAPYAEHFTAHYPKTKMQAERLVLTANGNGLKTVALRPHLILGPGDNQIAPRFIARHKAGSLRLIDGAQKMVDTVYVDDAADAHLLAADALERGTCAGKAYFITQDDPRPQKEVINRILDAAGLPPVEARVSYRVAYTVGAIFEFVYGALRIESEPRMTRFVAEQLGTAHWYDIRAARRDLGYSPRVSFDEGMERLAAWLGTTGSRGGD